MCKLVSMEDAMHDRRKLDRKYLTIYSRVFDRVSGRLLGYLADLSEKGAMIISDEPIPRSPGNPSALRFI